MANVFARWILAGVISLVALGTSVPAMASGPIDAGLFTTYEFVDGLTELDWVVCGSTQDATGCYSSGQLGPFENVGALMEGNPRTKGDQVTRDLYIVDVGTGSSVTSITLYVYKKVDTISSNYDSATVTLVKTITLALGGGTGAVCYMAANNSFLFIATDQGPQAFEVNKSSFKPTQVEAIAGINISSITADKYGFVTITQGNGIGNPPVFGFAVYGPKGDLIEDGGGESFMLNTIMGVSASALPGAGTGTAQ